MVCLGRFVLFGHKVDLLKWFLFNFDCLYFCSFANSRLYDDSKQIFSSFMLSISAVIMTYLQNPLPMTLPFQDVQT